MIGTREEYKAFFATMGLMAAADGLDGGYLALAYVGSDGTYFTGGAR